MRRTSGGIITAQMLTGSLRYVTILNVDFSYTLSDGTVEIPAHIGTQVLSEGTPVPFSAAEQVCSKILSKCRISQTDVTDSRMVLSLENTSNGWEKYGLDGKIEIAMDDAIQAAIREMGVIDTPTGQVDLSGAFVYEVSISDLGRPITFLELVDTPNMYGTSGQTVKMNETGDGLIYETVTTDFVGLTDTPNSYGSAGQVVVVNPTGDGLEYVEAGELADILDNDEYLLSIDGAGGAGRVGLIKLNPLDQIEIGDENSTLIQFNSLLTGLTVGNDDALSGVLGVGGTANLIGITADDVALVGDDTILTALRSLNDDTDPVVRKGTDGASVVDYKIWHEGTFNPDDKIDVTERAIPDGVATLDSNGKLSSDQIPDEVVGGLIYQGLWDANLNEPEIVSGVGVQGHFYRVNVAGTTEIDGVSSWEVGDWVAFNGSIWEKVDNTELVTSVAGRTGDVILVETDITDLDKYTQVEVDNLFAGHVPNPHTHVETDITDLDKYTQVEVDNLFAGHVPNPHTHVETDITDLDKYTQLEVDNLFAGHVPNPHTHVETDITDLDKYTQLEVDDLFAGHVPNPHTHVETDITDLDKYSTGEIDSFLATKSDVGHGHVIADVTDLQVELDTKFTDGDWLDGGDY